MHDWPTDDRAAEDLAREAEYFARVEAAEAWAAEIERLALLGEALADGFDGDDDPDGALARQYDRWAA